MTPPGEFPNILLVTVDCLRRDRISAYGHPNRTTPFLDSLLDRSLHATAAHAAAPWTAPSVVSLLSGLWPHSHGAGLVSGRIRNVDLDAPPSLLPAEVPLLPEMLGVPSAAFLGVWTASLPFRDRFDVVRLMDKDTGSRLAQAALSWIGEQPGPWLCWVHLGEPHDPLDVPKDLRDEFGDTGRYRTTRRWRFTSRADDVTGPDFAEYRAAREALYDAAVLAADRIIEGLWNALGDVRDRTVLAVTADHGEEMWEHREEEIASFADPRGVAGVGHGHTLFQELLLVPLILHGPAVRPASVEHPVSLVDLAPTLLAVTGRPEKGALDGLALGAPSRPVVAQGVAYGHEKRAVIDGGAKLIVSADDGYERAFRLDPVTWREAAAGSTADVERLRPLLPPDALPSADSAVIEGEMEGHLRDLGYIE